MKTSKYKKLEKKSSNNLKPKKHVIQNTKNRKTTSSGNDSANARQSEGKKDIHEEIRDEIREREAIAATSGKSEPENGADSITIQGENAESTTRKESAESAEPTKTGKRGRPAGSKNRVKENDSDPLKGFNDSEREALNKMNEFASEAGDGGEVKPDPQVQEKEKVLITGYFLLTTIDTLFPFAIHIILKQFAHTEVPPNNIMLSKEQFEKVLPMADKAAEYLAVSANPVAVFLISMATMYTRNTMDYIFTKK